MLHLTLVLLSDPRFKRWAIHNARRQGLPVVVVLNSSRVDDFGDLDNDIVWLESKPGKPYAQAAAADWMRDNAPDAMVVQHDQDDHYPEGSASEKLAALRDADLIGSPVRRVWFERTGELLNSTCEAGDHWNTWGGAYAWRASAFVPHGGPSVLFDDVCWCDAMVKAGARFAHYETRDTYCRWVNHRHVWRETDDRIRQMLRLEPAVAGDRIRREAAELGALHEDNEWRRQNQLQ